MFKVSTISPCYNMKQYLPGFLQSFSQQSIVNDIELVLNHKLPDVDEINLVKSWSVRYPNIKHEIVNTLTSIPVSMNQCVYRSSGEYLCIWNIDDLRTANSIELMANSLDENPEVDFVYGNFITVNKFGMILGGLVDVSNRESELGSAMILGPFFMFRRSAILKSGLFDEQLISGADFCFALRLAANGRGLHLPQVVGYYLNAGKGESTKPGSKQPLERTVIELRYGLPILDPTYVSAALDYDLDNLVISGSRYPVSYSHGRDRFSQFGNQSS